MEQGGTIVWVIDADASQFQSSLKGASKDANNFARTLNSSVSGDIKNFTKSVGGLASAVGNISFSTLNSTAQIAATTLLALGTKGIQTGSYLQSLQLQMNGLTKSVELGSKAMSIAQDYWQNNPFQRVDVSAATRTLIAFGGDINDLAGNLKILGNVSLTSGVPIDALAGIFGRVSAQGRLMGGDIQQLTENGVSILPALQKALNKTANEVREMASAGEIDFKTFRSAMESIVDPSIIDQMTNTLPRQIDRLKGALTNISLSFVGSMITAEAGYTAAANGILQAVTTLTKNVADTLKLSGISEAAQAAGNAFVPIINALSRFFTVVQDGESQASPASKLITGFFNFIQTLGPALIPIIGLLALSFSRLFSGIPIIGELLGGLSSSFSNLTNAIGNVAKSGADLFIGRLGEAIKLIPNLFDIAANAASSFVSKTISGISSLIGVANQVGSAISNSMVVAFLKGSPDIEEALNKIKGNLASIIPSINSFVGSFIEAHPRIQTALTNISNAVNNTVSAVSNAASFLATPFVALGNKISEVSAQIELKLISVKTVLGGMAESFARNHPIISNAMSSIASDISSAVSSITNKIPGVSSALSSGLVSGMKTAGDYAKNVFSKSFDVVGGAVSKLGSMVGSVASSLAGPMLAGISTVAIAAATMGADFGKKVDEIVNMIVTKGPEMATNFANNIIGLANSIAANMPQLITAFSTIFTTLANFIITNGPTLITQFTNIVIQLVQQLTSPANVALFASAVVTLFTSLATNMLALLPVLFQALITVLTALLNAFADPTVIGNLIDSIVTFVVQMADIIVTNLPIILDAMFRILSALINKITEPDILQKLINATVDIIVTIATALLDHLPQLIDAMVRIILALAKVLTSRETMDKLWNAAKTIGNSILNALSGIDIVKVGSDLVRGLWDGISNMGDWIGDKLRSFGKNVLKDLKSFFGIKSPSRVMRDQIGKMLGLGIAGGITESTSAAVKAANNAARGVLGAFDNLQTDIGGIQTTFGVDSTLTAPSNSLAPTSVSNAEESSTQNGTVVNQNNYVYTELDMDQVNRNLTWELNRR